MSGNKRHTIGHERSNVADRRPFHGAHIGNDCPGLEARCESLGQGFVCTQGGTQQHKVGVGYGLRRVGEHRISQAQIRRCLTGFRGSRTDRNVIGNAVLAHHPGDRRAYQPQTDNGHALKQGTHEPTPKCSSMAAISSRISSSVPTVMRKQSVKP